MGATAEEGGKADKQKLPNGDVKKSKKKPEESSTKSNKDDGAGCCQGGSGLSCCRDGSLEQNGMGEEKNLKETASEHEKKGLGKLSLCMGSLEQSEVLTAVAVVSAVAAVAVAYSFYKRSG